MNNNEPIAIVGLSSLFPDSPNLQNFWGNIVDKKDCITDIPETHWDINDFYDSDPAAPDKTYCKRGGFLPTTEFNPMEFGIPPNTLDVVDILQLLSLTVAKSALFNAGYLSDEKFRSRTGVVLGITGANSLVTPLTSRLQSPLWKKVLLSRGLSEDQAEDIIETIKKSYAPWEEQSFPGMLGNVVAGRIANRFNLGGTNCTIDAACASSLAALRMAMDELHTGRADVMLTGGCDAENTILMFMCFSKTPAFSKAGIIRPFDINSDGTLIGEGMGMLVLKRLSDAERDNDQIYGVIRGLGSSSDGRFKSIYAPRKEGQIKCLERAYEDAGFSPNSIGLIEAHGTGTKVGDATEVSALKEVLGDRADTDMGIALGSVKSQIGHTKAAAGAASMIKTTLALHHKVLPASINITSPNPSLGLDDSPLYLNDETRPWLLSSGVEKRRAGVSSFGFGGTNFHVVLEEYSSDVREVKRLHRHGKPILIAGRSIESLHQQLDSLIASEGDFEKSTTEGTDHQYRLGFVGENREQICQNAHIAKLHLDKLADKNYWHHPSGIYFANNNIQVGKVAALFSGQGSQYVNMSRQAAINFPQYIEMFELAEKEVLSCTNQSLASKVYPKPVFSDEALREQEGELRKTAFAQPAIGCVSSAAFSILSEAGFSPDCVSGHSFGELTAIWASGSLSNEDYARLAAMRGHAMTPPEGQEDGGTMVAVNASEDELNQLLSESGCKGVYLCNFNTSAQTVIGGSTDDIDVFLDYLANNDCRFSRLPVSGAFHTPLVAHSQEDFAKAVDAVTFSKPKTVLYRNVDAKKIQSEMELKEGLKKQLLEAVRFKDIIEKMYEDGVRTFVEFGPSGLLCGMVKSILNDVSDPIYVISSNSKGEENSALQLNSVLTQLSVLGLPLSNFDTYYSHYREADRKPGHCVKLSGVNYVSDDRKNRFNESLSSQPSCWTPPLSEKQSGDLLSPEPAVVVEDTASFKELELPLSTNVEKMIREPNMTDIDIVQSNDKKLSNLLDSLEVFELVKQQQASNSTLHESFMSHAVNNIDQTLAMIQKVSETCSQQPDAADNLTRMANNALDVINQGRSDTTRVHENYMSQHRSLYERLFSAQGVSADQGAIVESINNVQPAGLQLEQPKRLLEIKKTASPSKNYTKKSTSVSEALDSKRSNFSVDVDVDLSEKLLEIVSDKTGYPADVIDPSMDIEADLGIDSIKRVEILAAIKESLPGLPEIDHEKMGELKTIGDISTAFGQVSNDVSQSIETEKNIALAASSNDQSLQQSSEAEDITGAFLSIVSEKTGYPKDILELNMDLEADLGIDSIKRVEILSGIQSQMDTTYVLEPEKMIGLKTLGDIIDFIQYEVFLGGSKSEKSSEFISSLPSKGDADNVQKALLKIVSDKTGYPTEVIELKADLESDLGVDSIKRVEILGALQTEFPELNVPTPELLGEMRTLEQIVSAFNDTSGRPASIQPVRGSIEEAVDSLPSSVVSGIDVEGIQQALLQIVSEKTGYPVEVIETEADLESDLGVDSIKRVEILGSLQTKFPDLSVPSQELLGEMRTLEKIVSAFRDINQPVEVYVEKTIDSLSSPVASGIDVEGIQQALLQIVSEKTGYPVEVIETEADLESDLGVDSIKRVEILGALQAKFPELSVPNQELLGEMRTLEKIVSAFKDANGRSVSTVKNNSDKVMALPEIEQFSISKSELKVAEPLLNAYGSSPSVLLIAESTDQTHELIKKLNEKSFSVHVLCFPGVNFKSKSKDIYRLTQWDEKTLKETLESIPDPDLVIYQHDNNVSNIDEFSKKSIEIKWLQHLLLLAGHYKKLLDTFNAHRKGFITITRIDGRLGLEDPGNNCLSAACFGLMKTLAVESNSLFCRALDVEPSLSVTKVAAVSLEEIFDHQVGIVDVGWYKNQRYTFSRQDQISADKAMNFSDNTCFIVTGGARGITASCINALASRQAGRYLLLGRSSFDKQEPLWAVGVEESQLKQKAAFYLKETSQKVTPRLISNIVSDVLAWREINETLNMLKASNVEARYQKVDIANSEEVASWVNSDQWLKESDQWVLIHGAGALSDKLIEDKSIVDMQKVFSGKVIGASNLIRSVNSEKLKLVCLFSSVAGLFGNKGQSDYAMANEVLNRMARALQNQRKDIRAISIIWGAWNAGMVTPALKKMFESRGIPLIELDNGVERFSNICLNPPQEALTVVGPGSGLSEREYRLNEFDGGRWIVSRNTEYLLENKLLKDHQINNTPILPATFALGWIANTVEGLFPGCLVSSCDLFQVNKGLAIDTNMNKEFLFDISVDSTLDEQNIILDVKAYDPSNNRVHYSCKGMNIKLQGVNKESSYSLPEFYSNVNLDVYGDGTLFHGEAFQLLRAFQVEGKNEMVFRCCQSSNNGIDSLANHSASLFCPLNADALLQSALVWVRKYENIASLPAEIRNMKCYQVSQLAEDFYVRVEIKEKSESYSVLRLIAQTQEGEIFLELDANVVKSHALEEKFSAV